jgi:thioesterase III
MNKILEKLTKVRFQDCDPFNHLNNSSYIDYFMNAREDQILENYNLDIYEHLRTTGQAWVVASNQISYLKPAMMNETILIESKLIYYNIKSLLVEMQMWDKNRNQLKAIFWSKFVYFSTKTQQSVQHANELVDLFKQIVVPVEQKIFEERCLFILKTIKERSIQKMTT